MIQSRVLRTGDGSHRDVKKLLKAKESLIKDTEMPDNNTYWGFGDKEMTEEDMKKVTIIQKYHA